ncbi:MAG: PAS domain S-box protein [Verrucomicrobia bacterium]|nr:PAS domain S-box protein [Verrucomicrobiota bacterium]
MNPHRILVVEDEAIVAMDLQDRLVSLGYELAGRAASGEQALALAGEARPSLVLMDIRLQGAIDGIAAAKEIRRQFKVPVIFLTAYSEDSTLQRAKLAEPFGYILKPFEDRELKSAIEIALYKHHTEEEIRRLSRLYAALSQVNQAIVRVRTREELCRELCRVIVVFGEFKLAWIGWLDAKTQEVAPVAHHGEDEDFVLKWKVSADHQPEACGPTGVAVRDGRTCVANDFLNDPCSLPWREEALRRGLRAVASFPIRLLGQVCGALTVAASELGFFGDKEVNLLEEAAGDISFALDSMEKERLRWQAEVALKESEGRYRALVENAAEVIAVAQDGHFRFVNPEAEAISGYSRAELTSRPFLDFVHPEDREWVASNHQRRLRGEAPPTEFETRIIVKGGAVRWLRIKVAGIAWEGAPATLNFFTDITERKQAEERTRQETARTEALLNLYSQAPHLTDAGLYERVLDTAVKLTRSAVGFLHEISTDQGAITRTTWSPGAPEPCRAAQAAGGPMASEENWTRCVHLKRPIVCNEPAPAPHHEDGLDGPAATPRFMCIPVADGERVGLVLGVANKADGYTLADLGQFQLVANELHRILAQRRDQADLRESEERFRSITDQISDVIFVLDEQGVVSYASEATLQSFGFAPAEVIGHHFTLFIGSEDMEEAGAAFTAAVKQGQPARNLVLRMKRKDGSLFPGEVNAQRFQRRNMAGVLGVIRDVTERHQAEAALRESELRFRQIVENSLAGYFRIDARGRLVTVNSAWLRMHGYASEQEVIGQHFSLTQRPEDLVAAEDVVRRLLAGERVSEGEFSRRNKDGSTGYHAFSVSPVRQDGQVVGLEGFLIDTTALQAAQADYAMLFGRMIDGFALHEILCNDSGQPVDYRFLAVNPAFEKLTGLDAASVVGRKLSEVLPQAESFWVETYGRVALTGEPTFFEHYNQELGRFYQVSAFSPAPGRFATVFVDETERRQAQDALQHSEAELAAIYDSAPLMMCLVNDRREVERMNRAMSEMAGSAADTGRPCGPGDYLGCVHALDDPRGCGAGAHCGNCPLRAAILDTLQLGLTCRQLECSLFLTRQGVRRELRVLASTALVRVEGQPKALVCLEDITARKQLEAQLLQAQKMEAIGQLAGGVAHDFNNILAATLMQLHMLQEMPNLEPEVAASLKELEKAAQRAANLTRQLLMFSRRQTMQTKRLDLNEVVSGLLRMLRRLLGEHIEIVWQMGASAMWVEADAGMLEQVLMNLCVNARDAMPKGGRLSLDIKLVEVAPAQAEVQPDARAGRFVCLSVTDTGSGMDANVLEHLFEPFFTTKDVGKGTGLGLATVYGIVKQHQGWVKVDSKVGCGTVFRVYLPFTAPAQIAEAKPLDVALPRGTETLLVVEDDDCVRNTIVTTLRRLGYRVVEATHGVEALQLWDRHGHEVDLLLTDMVMPKGMTGLELADHLRSLKPDLKVVISSGYSADLAHLEQRALEGMRLLPKPYSSGDLARTMRECLEEEAED